MNEEEKETIKYFYNLRALIDEKDMLYDEGIGKEYGKEKVRQITIILNLIVKLQKENEEKNKIIDSMIKVMIENSICDYFIKEKCKNYAGENGKTCDECIKQYFENKVKEVK